ncbi:MAG TPA: hypothetical protein VN284_14700 [Rhizobium sp.]|nr:hypothetical protein [Rhizobium sp.]
MQHLKMLQQQRLGLKSRSPPIRQHPGNKKAGTARFSAPALPSDREAASSSVVSIAPVRSKGSSFVRPAATESCSCRSSRDHF